MSHFGGGTVNELAEDLLEECEARIRNNEATWQEVLKALAMVIQDLIEYHFNP